MWLNRIPPLARRVLLVLSDFGSIGLSLYLSFYVRFDGNMPSDQSWLMRQLFLVQLPIRLGFFYFYGLYRGMWRYASMQDLMTIFRAVSLSSLVAMAAVMLSQSFPGLPRSVFVMDWIFTVTFVGGVRFLVRALQTYPFNQKSGKRVLIFGAGDAGEGLLRRINVSGTDLRVIGFADDAPPKQMMRIHGVPVLGGRQDLPALVLRHQIEEIFIAIPSAPPAVFREIVSECHGVKVRFRRVPSSKDLLNGRLALSHLPEVQLEDLLGRAPVTLENENVVTFLRDKIVMVTGAGGSIGSELCRQIAHFKPRHLIMLDQAENGLYEADMDMRQKKLDINRNLVIADITDARRVSEVFAKYRPQIIFHAAAHKHVPMMEMNKKEAIKNNVLGSRTLAEAAHRFDAEKFVMISTDKAVNPTSIMGASKRLAEMLLQGMSKRSFTAFTTVRFGNVLGSNGSVVPLFKKQLLLGGPLTVTHPDIERFFMTIPEAVQLVLQAGAMGKGGEIYILDMGQPIKIVDLARNLITLSGYTPEDIGIKFVGLRPGEKLYEELWITDEKVLPTGNSKIMIAEATPPAESLEDDVDDLLHLIGSGGNEEKVLEQFCRLVANYKLPVENSADAKPALPTATVMNGKSLHAA